MGNMQDNISLKYCSIEQLLDIRNLVNAELKQRKYNPKYIIEYKKAKKMLANSRAVDVTEYSFNYNNKEYRAIPAKYMAKPLNERFKFLLGLLEQDWTRIFDSEALLPERNFYVYGHCDPSNPISPLPDSLGGSYFAPFYIGKGTGKRAYDLNRNQGHGIRLRQLKARKIEESDIIRIFATNLTESEAFALEAKLIYYYGTIYDKSIKGYLLNLDIPKKPKFDGVIENSDITRKNVICGALSNYKMSKKTAKGLYKIAGEKCQRCESVSKLEIIRKTPIRLGGTNEEDNFEVVCCDCKKQEKQKRLNQFKIDSNEENE